MKKVYLIIAVFLLFVPASICACSSISKVQDISSKAICLAFFGTSGCHYCEEKWSIVASFESYYSNLIVMRFDYGQKNDRELQDYLFTMHNLPLNSPRTAVFIGNDYLLGENITEKTLRLLIEKYLESGAKPVWRYIYLAYFGFSGCFSCELDWNMINRLKEDYPILIPEWFDCRNQSVIALENGLFELYCVDAKAPRTALFVGNHCILSDDIYEENLRRTIEIYAQENIGTIPPWKLVKSVEKPTMPPISIIIISGLADGINPCAFTVLIFFVSYLSYLGKGKIEIALTGVSFIVAVFLAYLIMGFGLLLFLVKLEVFPIITILIKVAVASFALILALINIYDYCLIKKGKFKKVTLRLPQIIHAKIHSIIRKTKEAKFTIPFAFLAGLVISLFELTCTGQVYFPILALLAESSLQVQAFLYLLLYNVMFILPLLTVFMVVFFGISLKSIGDLIAKHTGKLKLFTAFVLLVLATILILQLINGFSLIK
jgi:cytochrome c biogenesis protein CcdA